MPRLAVWAFGALLPFAAWAADEPAEYRMDEFRAPVPATLAGATVVGPETAYDLWQTGQVAFVDVLPQAPKPAGLPEGTIWHEKKRNSIPGTIWLPNVGYGALAESYHAYFREGLSKATSGDMDHPVLFFCLEDCWMSWNAAKRALEYGYTTVYWLPEGTDGWALWDYPLEEVKPEPEPK
ncbi:PQQ-dependent catabolism-associated CXXCW motif protein [Puniceibacterium sediminis]|uniref:PQQ-dependent catabolism-associated CXXCW motif protein n=1 Tax=Puniceibacterium sediminis TaxID=1608407 RepID=A0A238Y852_9RHOB|nr:PQQ-dependent catabolism-associated CXXCW motif protein [Puniceibacterium sediminis]SNR67405.1 PQQ-dependent catabolism-associated CXXCW motif protein [Puniceibacterium sediminis]